MLDAPPITLVVRRDRVLTIAVALVGALAGVGMGLWVQAWFRHRGMSVSDGAAGVALTIGLGAFAAWGARRMVTAPIGNLHWDGRAWWWTSDFAVESAGAAPGATTSGLAGTVRVRIDAGPWILMQFTPQSMPAWRGSSIWIALSRHDVGEQWHPFRATLHSRAALSGLRRDASHDKDS